MTGPTAGAGTHATHSDTNDGHTNDGHTNDGHTNDGHTNDSDLTQDGALR